MYKQFARTAAHFATFRFDFDETFESKLLSVIRNCNSQFEYLLTGHLLQTNLTAAHWLHNNYCISHRFNGPWKEVMFPFRSANKLCDKIHINAGLSNIYILDLLDFYDIINEAEQHIENRICVNHLYKCVFIYFKCFLMVCRIGGLVACVYLCKL